MRVSEVVYLPVVGVCAAAGVTVGACVAGWPGALVGGVMAAVVGLPGACLAARPAQRLEVAGVAFEEVTV